MFYSVHNEFLTEFIVSYRGLGPAHWATSCSQLGRHPGYGWLVLMGDHVTCPKMEFPKREILMNYIIRSCDLLGGGISKNRNFDGLCKQVMWFSKSEKWDSWMAYISRSCDWITKKGNFDGLHNQVMWLFSGKWCRKFQKINKIWEIQINSNKFK